MKIILLKDVPKVGRKYEVKEINDGYAVNLLLPKKLAIIATTKTLAEVEKLKNEIKIEKEIQEDLLMKNLEEIKNKVITIKTKADEKGHLFSAIHKKNLITEMEKEHHIEIKEEFLDLEKPIKEIGEFEIPISVQNKKSFFKLVIEKL